MKTFKFLTIFIFGVLLFITGCSDDNISTPYPEAKQNLHTNNPHTCGSPNFNTSEDGVVEQRQEEFDEPAIGDPCDVANLTISLDDCFDDLPIYLTALNEAVAMYNAVPNSLINISVVDSGADIHIDCINELCDPFQGVLGGTAREFYDGTNDPNLLINTNVAEMELCCGFTFQLCDFTGLMAHEIAHVIGLAHTGSGDGNQIAGTLVNDPASLFNGGALCNGICTFSVNDIIALQTLYPQCDCVLEDVEDLFLTGPLDLCLEEGETGTVTVCLPFVPQGFSLFEMDGTPINGNCLDFSYDLLGTFNAQIQVCHDDTGCCQTLSKSIVVFDGNCCASCYCECQELVEVTSIGPFSVYNGGNKKPTYRTVRHEIPCWDDTPCSELYPEGDELFDCERIVVNDDLELTITGDDVLCWDEEGIFCINGLPDGTDVDWDIEGPSGPVPYSSSGNCLVITFGEIGTFTVSTTICVNDCCQDFSHTVENKECEEKCYCLCDYGDGDGTYEPVEMEIDCDDDCDEVFPEGDEYFDCKKIVREE